MRSILSKYFSFFFLLTVCTQSLNAQSVAREWNEVLLESIRNDFARPTVHARNLFHMSAGMYDIWALTDDIAEPYFMGKTVSGFEFPIDDFPITMNVEDIREEAISYFCYRLLANRFNFSPEGFSFTQRINNKMGDLGYNPAITSTDYSTGDPAALGNYVAQMVIDYGLQDGSYQIGNYGNQVYQPVNQSLVMDSVGNYHLSDPNRWQPLTLDLFIDQAGNPIPFNTPPFLSPEWGQVSPFALTNEDLTIKQRDNNDWWIYHDPGDPPLLSEDGNGAMSDQWRWGFQLVSIWSSHLDPADDTMIDISPASIGNITDYPSDFEEYDQFYNLLDGGDPSNGHALNPVTGMPYQPQMVRRADYGRILAEFWADGPDSETPPGHWFTLLNYVSDHPQFEKRYKGEGEILDDLEWDVKSYLLMGGAMHDCAITAWGIKGYYDYIRPVSAIRFLAEKGQRTDPSLPSYDPQGFDLIPGYIEVIEAGDPLAIADPSTLGEIKLYAWRGPDFIDNPQTDIAGVGWIPAKNWWPYQRPSFVTPNFAGYISGHSTFSSAAAEIMEFVTGDAFFPGGMGEFEAPQDEFLVFERGPSETMTLQWATYKDASEQTSLSRIWGGIHPPADDIPGRLIGTNIAEDVYAFAEDLFFIDADNDGFYYFEDCDDENAAINPDGVETCNGADDDCNGSIDEGLAINTYYQDADGDGYGSIMMAVDTCLSVPPAGFVTNSLDCEDTDNMVNVDAVEICDGIDNNCSGAIDDNIPYYDYYRDADGDGFGDPTTVMEFCSLVPPAGFVADATDCDDNNAQINSNAVEICDGIDNNCSGSIDDGIPYYDYYRDADGDGYGDIASLLESCYLIPPTGYVMDNTDCDDSSSEIFPGATEIPDNDIDEDCNGRDYYRETRIFPNPVTGSLIVRFETEMDQLPMQIYSIDGRLMRTEIVDFSFNEGRLRVDDLAQGHYLLRMFNTENQQIVLHRFFKI